MFFSDHGCEKFNSGDRADDVGVESITKKGLKIGFRYEFVPNHSWKSCVMGSIHLVRFGQKHVDL